MYTTGFNSDESLLDFGTSMIKCVNNQFHKSIYTNMDIDAHVYCITLTLGEIYSADLAPRT